MKFKTTRKAVVNGSSNIIRAGYCSLATLLRNHEPVAYTCGVYGWNFDVYEVYGVTICTGYRGMPGRSAYGAIIYEEQAQKVVKDYSKSWDERRDEVEELLKKFCVENGGKVARL